VSKGPKSGKLKTRKGRASLKTRKGRASLKPRKGLVQGLPLGRKLSQFFFFFVWVGTLWAGTLWALVTIPKGPEKLKFFQGIFFAADKPLTGRASSKTREGLVQGKLFSGKSKNAQFDSIINILLSPTNGQGVAKNNFELHYLDLNIST
jgi:hypothetical protein